MILALLTAFAASACSNNTPTSAKSTAETTTIAVEFCADSAWQYVADQVAFGPRTPASESHAKCLDYLTATLTRHGATVHLNEGTMTLFNSQSVPVKNIVAQYLPDKANRLILCAHWDCRMFADQDADRSRIDEPIDGANDGASGVGVLLEVARQLNARTPAVGVDIVLFDVEDNGTPDHLENTCGSYDTWCLGSQMWAREEGKTSTARYGILLDMVGAPGATFMKEQFSQIFANEVVEKVWNAAAELGYANYFVDESGAYITDDHYYMHEIAGIEVADIIQFDPTTGTSFGAYWHTHNDVLDNVDKQTLEAVGRTVLSVVYSER